MSALFYLLFLGCLGFLVFCADLIRWPISWFQLPNRHANETKRNPDPRAQQFLNSRIPQTLASSARLQPLVSIPGRVG
jgi:hypothetical protein